MKYYSLILIFSYINCIAQTDKRVQIFEETLGKRNAEVLTELVVEFESRIKDEFNTKDLKKAYTLYFMDNCKQQAEHKIFREPRVNGIFKLLNESGLEGEIIRNPTLIKLNGTLKYRYVNWNNEGGTDTVITEPGLFLRRGENIDSLIKVENEREIYEFNYQGRYIEALKKSADKDSVIINYIISREAMAFIPDWAFCKAFYDLKVDINDYFIKRIVLIELLY